LLGLLAFFSKANENPAPPTDSSPPSEVTSLTAPPADDAGGEESDPESDDSKNILPFPLKSPTAKEAAEGRRLFTKAVSYLSQKKPEKAVKALLELEPTERLAQVYRHILLGRALREAGRRQQADSVYTAGLRWIGSQSWRNYFIKRRMEGFDSLRTTAEQQTEFFEQVVSSDASKSLKADALYRWLKHDGYRGEVGPHLERLRSLMVYARGDKRLDSVYTLAATRASPGKRTWDEEWMLLQMEARLGEYTKAIARCEILLPLVPTKGDKQKLHWQLASLLYAKSDWSKAYDMYQKYLERYGDNPQAFLQSARCLDKQGQIQKAQMAYDRFLELYPKHPKTSEIQWLRAWEREADGRFAEAIELYYLQLSRFPRTKRADWAQFRIGLCHFKDSNFAASQAAFGNYRAEKSVLVAPAGWYWEAKSWSRLSQVAVADSLRLATALTFPFSFYGHSARMDLNARGALPDSLQPWNRFSPSRPAQIKAWMKEHLSGFSETLDQSYESAYLDLSHLLELHLDTLALLTMRSTPAKVKRNPWYLFVQARRFQRYDLHPEAYKLGRTLAELIPNEELGRAPKEILRLIWPRPYEAEVLKYAIKRKLDPALVYALMRQESGFDREIRSGAGAVGLMQLMPATARDQAAADSLPDFHPEDLVHAEVNVRLGTFYVKNLLGDYEGNPFFMLANYNAGPTPTRRWFKAFHTRSTDEMIEDISYWETRDYVKKVMGNFWTYKLLYNNRLFRQTDNQTVRP
jgi:tetratricopeptide (TPR) repeat protein